MAPPVLRDASSNSATNTSQATTQSVVANYIDVPAACDLSDQIKALGALYEIERSEWILETMRKLLERFDPDLKKKPGATYTGLHQLVAVDRPFEDADAIKAIADIQSLWSGLDNYAITKEEIKGVAQGLRDKFIVVEYGLLRPFVVEAVRQLRSKDHSPLLLDKSVDLGALMEDAITYVRLQDEDKDGGDRIDATGQDNDKMSTEEGA